MNGIPHLDGVDADAAATRHRKNQHLPRHQLSSSTYAAVVVLTEHISSLPSAFGGVRSLLLNTD